MTEQCQHEWVDDDRFCDSCVREATLGHYCELHAGFHGEELLEVVTDLQIQLTAQAEEIKSGEDLFRVQSKVIEEKNATIERLQAEVQANRSTRQ